MLKPPMGSLSPYNLLIMDFAEMATGFQISSALATIRISNASSITGRY